MEELIRKMYFEDINVGDIVESVGRTVTEADICSFAELTGDFNTLHTDAEFAKNSIAGQRLAHGLLGVSFAAGLYTRTAYNMAIQSQLKAMTEIKSWKFKKPILIGDTIHVVQEIISKEDSRPENDAGRIIMKRSIVNQRGDGTQGGEVVMLIRKRSHL